MLFLPQMYIIFACKIRDSLRFQVVRAATAPIRLLDLGSLCLKFFHSFLPGILMLFCIRLKARSDQYGLCVYVTNQCIFF